MQIWDKQVTAVNNYLIIVGIAIVLLLYGWYRWRKFEKYRAQKADANGELEWIEELAREYEKGTIDNRERLEWLIRNFESEHKHSAAFAERLENIRRILGKSAGLAPPQR